ncbi:hypothetical protein [uncultured Mobiluncus sp.]|uniref:hypothetical protein n=1 Tax=uncultured Mobiluncus sp. TaxID=293425 RepID=UPI0026165904|nr:hypothetical protein [uncultured Mobiluncus sp.]
MIKLAYTGTARLKNILTPYQPYGDPDMGKAIPQIRDNPPHLLIIHAPEPVYPIYGTPIEQIITELADSGTTVIVIQPDGAENIATGLPHTIYLTPQDDLTPYLIVAGLTPQPGTALTIEEPEPELESVGEPEPGLESVGEPEPGLESVGEPEPGLESVGEPEPGLESVGEPGLVGEPELESVAGVETGIKNEPFSETVWAAESRTEPEPESNPVGESELEPALVEEPEPESNLVGEPESNPVEELEFVSVEGLESIEESVLVEEPELESNLVGEPESNPVAEPELESITVGEPGSALVGEPELEANPIAEPESVEELGSNSVEGFGSGSEPVAGSEVSGEAVFEADYSWPVLDTVDGAGVTPVTQLEFVTEPEPLVEPEQTSTVGLEPLVEPEQEPAVGPESFVEPVSKTEWGQATATGSGVVADENSYGPGQALDEKPEPTAKLGTTPLNVEDGTQRVDSAEEFLSMTEPEPGSESEPESEPEPIVAVEPEPVSDSIPTSGFESMPTVETGHVSEPVTESVSEPVFESVFEPTPGVEATANGDTPDWLTPEPAPVAEPTPENSTPDWLTPEPAPVAEPTPENNTPDWLTPESVSDSVFEPAADPVFEAATDNKSPEPAPASTPSFEASDGNNNPSWLTPETTPVFEATADSTPNWLTQPIAEPASDFTSTVEPETMPVIEPASVVEPAPENGTPDWLAPEPTSESVPTPENGNNTPGWLTPGSTPVVEPMSENSTPGWLATEPISEPVSNPATVVEPAPETISGLVSEPVFESTVENDTPDWLAPTPVVEPAPENSTLDWLNPESVAEPKPDFMPTVEAESALEPATDNTSSWLAQPVSESAPVAEATTGSTPDWLTQPESATVVEPAPENSTPDWLTPEPVSNPATVVEPTPEPVSDPTPIDTPQNWTTTTTTTAQNTPDWVKQKTQTATTPTPTATTVATLTTPTRPTIPTITSTRHALATLISAKGGVGKTLLTITLADTAVRYGPGGYRVSIIDANRGQADIGPYLNLPETTPSIYQTTQNHNPLLQHLTPNRINQYRQGLGDVGYAVTLAPPTDLSDPHLIDTSLYTETINTITENSNLTLIDTATTENYDTTSLIEDVIIPATLNHAGWIIAVTDTSRTGATNLTKRLNQYFMKGVSPAKTIIVINQATNPNDPAYQQATKTLQPLGTPIITIPHSNLVYQLSAQARMATSAPNMAPPLQQVLSTVTGQPGFVNNTAPTPTTITTGSSPQAGNKSGFFNKLFK